MHHLHYGISQNSYPPLTHIQHVTCQAEPTPFTLGLLSTEQAGKEGRTKVHPFHVTDKCGGCHFEGQPLCVCVRVGVRGPGGRLGVAAVIGPGAGPVGRTLDTTRLSGPAIVGPTPSLHQSELWHTLHAEVCLQSDVSAPCNRQLCPTGRFL